MQYINNCITKEQVLFFRNIQSKIEEPLYFYGSCQRVDYFKGKSDIDVCIFSDNIPSSKIKLSNILNVPTNNFKKFVKLNQKQEVIITGYKMMYSHDNKIGPVEISIYNSRDKEDVLDFINSKLILPWYAIYLLYIIKLMHYYTPFLSKKIYSKMKNIILTTLIGSPQTYFTTLD